MNIKKKKLKLNFLHMTCLYYISITIYKLSFSNQQKTRERERDSNEQRATSNEDWLITLPFLSEREISRMAHHLKAAAISPVDLYNIAGAGPIKKLVESIKICMFAS